MAVRVLMQFVKPTMHLARPLHDREGRLLAGRGTALRENVVKLLRKVAVQSVLVLEDDEVESWLTVRPLDERLAELDRRFARERPSPALATLHAAIARHHALRWEHLKAEPAALEETRREAHDGADGADDAASCRDD